GVHDRGGRRRPRPGQKGAGRDGQTRRQGDGDEGPLCQRHREVRGGGQFRGDGQGGPGQERQRGGVDVFRRQQDDDQKGRQGDQRGRHPARRLGEREVHGPRRQSRRRAGGGQARQEDGRRQK